MGRHHPQDRFPLLVKFLDARERLSVQVHPDDAQAATLTPPDLGKTEAWVVLAAEPGSLIYAGLKRGFDRPAFEARIAPRYRRALPPPLRTAAGRLCVPPRRHGPCPGAGLLIAEIQQSSDTTYRLHDWNRVGPDGQPRPLHVEQALAVIDFERGPIDPVQPAPTKEPGVSRLVACDKFILDRWELNGPRTVGESDRCHILVVLSGSVNVAGDPVRQPLKRGETLLLPASLGAVTVEPAESQAELLDVYLP